MCESCARIHRRGPARAPNAQVCSIGSMAITSILSTLPIDCILINVRRVSSSDTSRCQALEPNVLFSQVFVWISRNQLLVESTQVMGVIPSYADHAIFNCLSLGIPVNAYAGVTCSCLLEINVPFRCVTGRTLGSYSSNALAFVWIMDTST